MQKDKHTLTTMFNISRIILSAIIILIFMPIGVVCTFITFIGESADKLKSNIFTLSENLTRYVMRNK
tara:strand:+ start:1474 stop:1674 length:201 start_codon:yes stop_codon:yes gene_type:complete